VGAFSLSFDRIGTSVDWFDAGECQKIPGTRQIGVEIYAKGRTPTGDLADFSNGFCAFGAPDENTNEHGVLGCRLFGRARFPEIVGKHVDTSGFCQKDGPDPPALACKIS
jgi:hypothetical protein